jgi:transposase-like protein
MQYSISLVELFRLFLDADAKRTWFAAQRWGGEPWRPHCSSYHVKHNPSHQSMPWRCAERECSKKLSVRIGTPLQESPLGYQTWAVAIYLLTTSLKGQSMKLHRAT